MKLHVLVKPNAREEKIEQVDETTLNVRVKAAPVDGKANEAVIKLLAKQYAIPKSRIRLLSGAKGKHKVFEML